ncbi:hypothetical protein [Burkholderia sp. BE17]|uniref:hypothetical protein n=1 Tax=Burkholderia sp. BE17 TaxID=2656644 RepID=UPI00128E1F8D|nr:hypothetical protein [Burkholderia sp. BE17]MPV64320.1 hypothetical protein [Burkholderia sp. BE17]
MENKHLVKAIVDFAIFLEYTDERLLDADVALGAMEQLSGELLEMSMGERKVFAQCCADLAPSYGNREQFVRDLPVALGIDS